VGSSVLDARLPVLDAGFAAAAVLFGASAAAAGLSSTSFSFASSPPSGSSVMASLCTGVPARAGVPPVTGVVATSLSSNSDGSFSISPGFGALRARDDERDGRPADGDDDVARTLACSAASCESIAPRIRANIAAVETSPASSARMKWTKQKW